jgi:hypothetical protein
MDAAGGEIGFRSNPKSGVASAPYHREKRERPQAGGHVPLLHPSRETAKDAVLKPALEHAARLGFHSEVEQWKLAGLITRRSCVRITLSLQKASRLRSGIARQADQLSGHALTGGRMTEHVFSPPKSVSPGGLS